MTNITTVAVDNPIQGLFSAADTVLYGPLSFLSSAVAVVGEVAGSA